MIMPGNPQRVKPSSTSVTRTAILAPRTRRYHTTGMETPRVAALRGILSPTSDIDTIVACGTALYGSQTWQAELTRALGLSSPRRLREYISGERSIPSHIWPRLQALLRERRIDLATLDETVSHREPTNGSG